MAEMSKYKRVKFPRDQQKIFLEQCKEKLKLTDAQMAKMLRVSSRTLTDWKREKFCMTQKAVLILYKKTLIHIPPYKLLDKFWYVHKGAKNGGLATYQKYGTIGGDQQLRKVKWLAWWKEKGRFVKNPILNRKKIKKPQKSLALAEFVGIVMGDGGITKRQLTITLHSIDDRLYSYYVSALIKQLFGIRPSVYKKKNAAAINLVISRTELVEYCHKKLGLVVGNKIKQQFDIPSWVQKDKNYKIACVRGLVDTDGSIFTHRYLSGGRQYSYKKLNFASASGPLRNSVYLILKEVGLHPRISGQKIFLDSQADMHAYLSLFGTHNPKHLKRYKK